MGAFDLGWQSVAAKNQQNRAIAEQERLQQQNTVGMRLLDSINQASNIKPTMKDEDGNIVPNPAYDQAQKDRAALMSQYSALNAPEQHASFAQHLHGLIFGKPETAPQQPALSPNSSPNAPTPPVAPAGQPTASSPSAPAPQHPMAPLPADHPANKITEGLKVLKNHLSAAANPLPPETKPDPALMAKYYRDPKEVEFERNKELINQRGENALDLQRLKNEYLGKMLMARKPALLSQTTIPHLLEQMQIDPTMTIVGPEGNELTPAQLAEMPANTVAREFRAGTQIFYALGDQNSKTARFGNITWDIPALGPITPENSIPLGIANPGATTTHQVPGMNPGEVITLHNTRTPETTGIMTPPVATPAAPPSVPGPQLLRRPDASASATPVPASANPGARAPGTKPQGAAIKTARPAASSMPPAFAPGTMLSQGRSAEPVVAAMSVVAGNVFGGNGEEPIWNNAWMYDKPEIRKALNNALTLNALANPGTEDNPSFLQTLATAIGATGWSQEQINDANVQARKELERVGGPEALKMFAREAALQEDLSALRTATKASAAQGSIRTLVRAAPVYNISSAQDFRNQLGTTLQTAASSMRGYPAINPRYVDWWDRGVSAAKGGPTSSNAPKVTDATQRPANVPAGYVLRDGPKGRGWYAPTAKK